MPHTVRGASALIVARAEICRFRPLVALPQTALSMACTESTDNLRIICSELCGPPSMPFEVAIGRQLRDDGYMKRQASPR